MSRSKVEETRAALEAAKKAHKQALKEAEASFREEAAERHRLKELVSSIFGQKCTTAPMSAKSYRSVNLSGAYGAAYVVITGNFELEIEGRLILVQTEIGEDGRSQLKITFGN